MAPNGAPLTRLGDGVWVASAPVRILGTKLTSTMTILRLGDGSLLVHSPIALTPERRTALEALGTVSHFYSPNLFHHVHIGDWAKAYPSTRVHAPKGLAKKRPDLRIDRVHGASPEPAFAGVVDEHFIDGFRLRETALFYRPARSLVVADLVHNVGSRHTGWTKFYTRAMGFYDRVAISSIIRWTAFSDRAAARKSLDALLALPFDHIVVGHGAPVVTDAREALRSAYVWL
jgi:hypothetical protein